MISLINMFLFLQWDGFINCQVALIRELPHKKSIYIKKLTVNKLLHETNNLGFSPKKIKKFTPTL